MDFQVLQERRENLEQKETLGTQLLGHLGLKAHQEHQVLKAFQDLREKQALMEQKVKRVPRVRKETEVLWDCPVLQDQLEFQDQQDQKERGAVKGTLELQDQ